MNVKTKLQISPVIKERWDINDDNILDSKSKADGYFVFKFCYEVKTGEFLCDVWPSNHKEIIRNYGKKPYCDYVRGIWFREKNIVYLRQHEREKLLFRTMVFLREHGVPNLTRIIWGPEAASELANELSGLYF
jgi:hypothetical protein